MQKRHRLVAVSVAAGLLGGGAVGAAIGVPGIAHGQTSTTASTGASNRAKAARDQFLQSTLAPLVKNHTITQAQADAVIKALKAAGPKGEFGHGPGPGFGHSLADVFGAAAKKIGVSTDDLRSALESGKTIADVAKSKNVKPQDVVAAMVAAAKTDLDQAVKDKRLSANDETQRLNDLTTKMTAIVNGTERRGFGFRHGGPRFGNRNNDNGTNTGFEGVPAPDNAI
jgi:hypothetical protein